MRSTSPPDKPKEKSATKSSTFSPHGIFNEKGPYQPPPRLLSINGPSMAEIVEERLRSLGFT